MALLVIWMLYTMMLLPMVIQFQLHECPGNYDAFLWVFSVFALVQFFDKDYVSSLFCPEEVICLGWGSSFFRSFRSYA
ncbi:uncharacterized protein LOC121467403 isoform X2 [Drosophila elegans]|nr:uncharacterized protein LOC121467403 isoform X2 [Drosophila elegans]